MRVLEDLRVKKKECPNACGTRLIDDGHVLSIRVNHARATHGRVGTALTGKSLQRTPKRRMTDGLAFGAKCTGNPRAEVTCEKIKPIPSRKFRGRMRIRLLRLGAHGQHRPSFQTVDRRRSYVLLVASGGTELCTETHTSRPQHHGSLMTSARLQAALGTPPP